MGHTFASKLLLLLPTSLACFSVFSFVHNSKIVSSTNLCYIKHLASTKPHLHLHHQLLYNH
ncbi:hypothetical protein YC2023_056560 [Brassica napus]